MQTYTIRVTIVLAEGQRFSRTGQYYNCADAFSAATLAFPEARYIGCINLGVTKMNHESMSQPKRTCYELGVCQQRTPPCRGCEPLQVPVKPPAARTPDAPRTAWAFDVSFGSWDLLGAVALVALAYFCAGYFG